MHSSNSSCSSLEEHTILSNKKNSLASLNKCNTSSSTSIYSFITQLWACFGKYVCMINVGLMGAFPVLAIPFLTSGTFKINMDQNEIGWMTSVIYPTMALGSILSALPFETNRKVPMMVAQALMTICWIMIYFATESWQIILARSLGGICMTLSLPHVQAYIGEVTCPKFRGIFGNLTQTMANVGAFIVSGLTYLHNWDIPIIVSGCFPALAVIYLYFIPESPVILIKKKMFDKAKTSLMQLRGWKWANEAEVMKEFRQLQKYCEEPIDDVENSGSDSSISTTDLVREYPSEVVETRKILQKNSETFEVAPSTTGIENPIFQNLECKSVSYVENKKPESDNISKVTSSSDKDSSICSDETSKSSLSTKSVNKTMEESLFKFLMKPEMYKPTLLMILCSIFIVGPGADSMLIYLKYYIQDFQSTADYNKLVTILTTTTFIGNLLSVFTVSKVGKRKIILLSMTFAAIGYIYLSVLHYYKKQDEPVNTLLFNCGFAFIFFVEEYGVRTVYHALMSEVFPLRGKKVGPMIVVLVLCMNGFLVMKNLPNIISTYGAISVIHFDVLLNIFGFICFYLFLIETEGKTLDQIVITYSGKTAIKKN